MRASARICLITLSLLSALRAGAGNAAGSCDHHVAQWLDPATGEVLQGELLFERLAGPGIVLLGETHTAAAQHRWQAYMLAALHSRNANMVVGFEMLPRRVQPALDAWSSGRLSEDEFLERSDWQNVWGYDARLYLPLFHFVRMNRLPAVALNVDRSLVSRVAREGWQAIGDDQRQGLSDPAPASEAYRDSLAELYAYKQGPPATQTGEDSGHGDIDLEEIRRSDEFANFVAAQLTWDRAMAEALAAAQRRDPEALVVGIAGRGHLEYGYGIPHQLADLGIGNVEVLLPLDTDDSCDPLAPELAAAVFVVDAETDPAAPARPQLGVLIEADDRGVRISEVVDDSVAAASGLRKGDIIVRAAGFETATPTALIEIIRRQAPGTWLPLQITRGDRELEIIARFPQSFD